MLKSYERVGKRALDLGLALIGLLGLSPILTVTGLCIWIEDRESFLFTQVRAGRYELPFTLWKFRSMPTDTPAVPSAQMLVPATTRVGGLIRRLSLDELPQLVNVLRGEMSLVGPRPALPSQSSLLALRRENGAARLRPGLTGLAQVNSYQGMSDEVKAKYDGEYTRDVSLTNDLRIIVMTARYLLSPPPQY